MAGSEYTERIISVLMDSYLQAKLGHFELGKTSCDINHLTDAEVDMIQEADFSAKEFDELDRAHSNVLSALTYLDRAARRVQKVHDGKVK